MTVSVMTLLFEESEVGYVVHSNCVDITMPKIFYTQQEAWEKRRSSSEEQEAECTCSREPTQVLAKGDCGHWSMWVCLSCRSLVHCPVSAESCLGFLSYGGSDEQIYQLEKEIEQYKDKQ